MSLELFEKERLKKNLSFFSPSVWILAAIMLVGIFLRTYNFHDWLYFYPDQARDLMIVSDYLSGKAPLPLLGFIAASTKFQLGAMYYYFQIISDKIFGAGPAQQAYPDVFFNILSIPLLYYFLKRFFKNDISLALTGIYTVSYYSIEFSRFAWNPNPMPFFVLLFLLSLWNFLCEKEKTTWMWIAALGVSVGIGIQLHTILLYLLTSVSFVIFVKMVKGDRRALSRWIVVFLLAAVLNTNQIVSETNHNFSNTRQLFKLSVGASDASGASAYLKSLELDTVCHAQANGQIISSMGNRIDCDYLNIVSSVLKNGLASKSGNLMAIIGIIASLLFSVFGYGLLIYFYRKEKIPQKKSFLGLILLYVGLSFLILYPVIVGAPLRYYLQLFFVPYILLGLILEFVREKTPKLFVGALTFSILVLVSMNAKTILSEADLYATNNHSQPQYVVLGELENMRDYIVSQTQNAPTVYMVGDGKYMQNYYKPLLYVLSEKNITLLREQKNPANVPIGEPLFYVGPDGSPSISQVYGFRVLQYRNFGEIGIYLLNTNKQQID